MISTMQTNKPCDIRNCDSYVRLRTATVDYKKTTIHHKNDAEIVEIVNDYLHIIHIHHNDDKAREFMSGKLGECSLIKCESFVRNRANASAGNSQQNDDVKDIVFCEIMDIIHCYLQHCYDTGNRLTTREKLEVECAAEHKQNQTELMRINPAITKIKQIISRKTQKIQTITNNITRQRYVNGLATTNKPVTMSSDPQKYSPSKPMISQTSAPNNITFEYKPSYNSGIYGSYMSQMTSSSLASSDNSNLNRNKRYHFGHEFAYGYRGEDSEGFDRKNEQVPIQIEKKYADLKEEMTQEGRLEMNHFQKDVIKSHVFMQTTTSSSLSALRDSSQTTMREKQELILSLMIYCNHDALQYHFSKTFREENGAKHNEFYWLGRYIKQAVHGYGDQFPVPRTNQDIPAFFHGVSEQFSFSSYLNSGTDETSIQIYGPLSTTSSLPVAVGFGKVNGLVIQFKRDYGQVNNYFSVACLSNFPDEFEHLFIQNHEALAISNIIHPLSGYDYEAIFVALQDIEFCTGGDGFEMIEQPELFHEVLQQQLNRNNKSCEEPNLYERYGQQICESYFNNRRKFSMSYVDCKEEDQFVFDMLFDSTLQWIKVDVLALLFPNVEMIGLDEIELCSAILDDVVAHLQQGTIKANKIVFTQLSGSSALDAESAVTKYESLFEEVNYTIETKTEKEYFEKASAWMGNDLCLIIQTK
eukprot:685271_1